MIRYGSKGKGTQMTVHENSGEVLRRAWAIFAETYHYPTVPFRSIGRRCFNSALRRAWNEARAAAELAAMSIADIRARLVSIEAEIDGLKYRGFARNFETLYRELHDEARPLTAELFRRSVAADATQLRLAA